MRRIITVALILLMAVNFAGMAQRRGDAGKAGPRSGKGLWGNRELRKEMRVKHNTRRHNAHIVNTGYKKAKRSLGGKWHKTPQKRSRHNIPTKLRRS